MPITRKFRLENHKGIVERETTHRCRLGKNEFSIKLTERQQLEGVSMVCSYMNCECYEISEGTVCYYQSTVSMTKIVEHLLEHNYLLNKCVKYKSFKIRATSK